MLGKVVPVL